MVDRFRMNKSPLTTVLLVLLTASAVASLVLCWRYISNVRELSSAKPQAEFMENNLRSFNGLAYDVLVYGSNNPNSGVPLPAIVSSKAGNGSPATAAKAPGK
jgi:hypothetical protein